MARRITISLDEAELCAEAISYAQVNWDNKKLQALRSTLELRILRAKTRARRLP